jgi:glycosyltransferase involved in cell wall biosynthesis
MQWSEDVAYRVCDKVISVLPAASGYMQTRGMPLRKFSYVPNGISFETTEPSSFESLVTVSKVIDDLRERGKFIIGYAGRFVAASTIDSLLRAISLCANDKLHLLLLGDGYLRLELESLCGHLGLTERVTFVGVVDKALVVPILSKLDALYLGLVRKPIFRFGVSPTKLNDYFMAARPVIYAVDAPEDPVALSGGGVSCKAENVQSIAAAIRQISSMNSADRDRMGMLGRNWLLSNRTYDRLAFKFLEAAFSDL